MRLGKGLNGAILACVIASGTIVGPAFSQTPTDTLLTTSTSPANIMRGLEIDAYQLGISAWVWGYPLVRMETTVREYTNVPNPKPPTSYRAPLNQIGWAETLATPDALDMPTANNDTVYMSAVVDLTEPYILSVPDMGDRYYVVDVFNMWQELQHYIGRRTTGTKAGRFALVPPGWKGELPVGVKALSASTQKVWLWGRLRVSPGEDMSKVVALENKFDLRPLSALGKANWVAPAAKLPPLPDTKGGPLGFYTVLASVLKDNAIKPGDAALAAQFERIHLTPGKFDEAKLSEPQRKGLLQAIKDAPLVAVSSAATTMETRNGWSYARGLDDFGYDYALRALIAGPYLGGQGEQEAVYPTTSIDGSGVQLNGAHSYVVSFDSPPPNHAFWSLTIYDANSKMMIENPIARYKVGSDTPGLKVDANGHFEIPISVGKDNGKYAANWLPAPKGDFYIILRVYQPAGDVMSGKWPFPNVTKVK